MILYLVFDIIIKSNISYSELFHYQNNSQKEAIIMSFIFEKDIQGQKFIFELTVMPSPSNKIIITNKYKGYKCSMFKVNEVNLYQPSEVSCYLETYQNTGPALCLKKDALAQLKDVCHMDIEKDSIYVTIPDKYKKDYIQMLNVLDTLQGEQEKKRREENDENIKDNDLIYVTRSQLYVSVTYPFDSNRETLESKEWTESIKYDDLDHWVENILAPYYVGMGCGSAQKYKITFKTYQVIWDEYYTKLKNEKSKL